MQPISKQGEQYSLPTRKVKAVQGEELRDFLGGRSIQAGYNNRRAATEFDSFPANPAGTPPARPTAPKNKYPTDENGFTTNEKNPKEWANWQDPQRGSGYPGQNKSVHPEHGEYDRDVYPKHFSEPGVNGTPIVPSDSPVATPYNTGQAHPYDQGADDRLNPDHPDSKYYASRRQAFGTPYDTPWDGMSREDWDESDRAWEGEGQDPEEDWGGDRDLSLADLVSDPWDSRGFAPGDEPPF